MWTIRTTSTSKSARQATAAALARRAYGGNVGFPSLWRLVCGWIVRRLEVHRQRRDLADLTPRELEDIGLTPEQAWRESRKPFWRE